MYKKGSIILSVHFSEEILQMRREWDDTFKEPRKKQNKTENPSNQEYCIWASSSFKNEKVKTFPDKQKLKEFITRPAL